MSRTCPKPQLSEKECWAVGDSHVGPSGHHLPLSAGLERLLKGRLALRMIYCSTLACRNGDPTLADSFPDSVPG